MKKLVLEASENGKDWVVLHEMPNPMVSPSEPIDVRKYNFIRYRIEENKQENQEQERCV